MPDWFYRTVAQRVLFSLPDETARSVALGVISTLGKSTPGRAVIEFMGHMAPDDRLAITVAGTRFASPIGLGWRVDPERRAIRGLSCFGVGCLEIHEGSYRKVQRAAGAALADGPMGASKANKDDDAFPLLRRHLDADGKEWVRLPAGGELPVVAWDQPVPASGADFSLGVVLQAGVRDSSGGWNVPAAMPAQGPEKIRAWRQVLPPGAPIIVSGGIDRPKDAAELVTAGADLMLIDAGLVYRGPGLVKRCNEAVLARLPEICKSSQQVGLFRRSWFWIVALGAALVAGGLAALGLALTRVLLPYDEHYLGLSSGVLEKTMPRVFDFMAHDRATLAGVMLGLGWMYVYLGWYGVRGARPGMKTAVIASALVGFASFFAFFGFGYFDTLHAFVAALLFQFTVQIMVGEEGGVRSPMDRCDEEDRSWRLAQWGQLCWVVHAGGLFFAGCLILGIGMTSVFVSEDLGFLCMTAQQAEALGERMIGVIAHDRASLGGMLLACGVAMLLPVLWCFRRGEAWLWWAIAGLGSFAYAAALGMHFKVGYTDWRHMVPAIVGLGLWLGGLAFTWRHLIKEKTASES
ncbi:MAG: hypothetical protein JNG82_02780 [Opitutaceae bacterium]|nr:hypothetical protein [Opitutaceae bacterium]